MSRAMRVKVICYFMSALSFIFAVPYAAAFVQSGSAKDLIFAIINGAGSYCWACNAEYFS